LVHEELLKIAEAAAPKDLGRFPALQRRLAAAVLEYIQVREDVGQQRRYVQLNTAYSCSYN
jgi:hypothetical protein